MKVAAIQQAKERLERARNAVRRMEEAETFTSFETPWSEFLLAGNGIYTKLEQGTKGCGKSQAWFGRKKHERKKDPLLQYLHQARNADEKGIGGTTLQYFEFKVLDDKVKDIQVGFDAEGNSAVQPVGESGIELLKRETTLHAVTNTRYGGTFMPPREHLGKPILEPTADDRTLVPALVVATLGLAYFERLFDEATKLPLRR